MSKKIVTDYEALAKIYDETQDPLYLVAHGVATLVEEIHELRDTIERKFPDAPPLQGRKSRLIPNKICPVCDSVFVAKSGNLHYVCDFGHRWAIPAKDTPNLPESDELDENK